MFPEVVVHIDFRDICRFIVRFTDLFISFVSAVSNRSIIDCL